MAPSRRVSNGRSPLVNQQRQITSFFSLKGSSSSAAASPNSVLPASSSGRHADRPKVLNSSPSPSPSPPEMQKKKKPLLVVGPSSGDASSPPTTGGLAPNGPAKRKRAAQCGEIVGRRIRVFWPLDKDWYEGSVKSFDEMSGKYLIVYDDAEEEVLDLDKEKFELLEDTVRSFRRLRKSCAASEVKMTPEKGSLVNESSGSEEDENSSDGDWGANVKETGEADDSEEEVDLVEDDEDVKGARTDNLGSQKRKNVEEKKALSAKKAKTSGIVQGSETKAVHASTGVPASGLGKDSEKEAIPCLLDKAPMDDAAERYGLREAKKLGFLGSNCRDANGRRPSDPNYDPKTLYLPPGFLKSLTGGQRQWWDFKSKHMDKVLFFKMGKFYELFEMDAHIGAKELDLQYMKGEQPHCGFPEKNFSMNAEKLANKGYRVLVVEQTETPEQLEVRRKEMGSKDKVVKREICAVVTKGTLTEGEMLSMNPDVSYLISLSEECQISDNQEKGTVIGVCVADVSTSRFIFGQFEDNAERNCLCSVLSELRPVEIIKPMNMLSPETERVLFNYTRNPLVNDLVPILEFWNAERTVEEVKKIYKQYGELNLDSDYLPEFISGLVDAGESGKLALAAFGGCLFYLRQAFLDKTLLRFAKYERLPCLGSHNTLQKPHMVLDSAALENLEIFENTRNGSLSGTLYAQLDHCVTAFGKRLLKNWLARPLYHVESIIERQDAVAVLKCLSSAFEFRKELSKLPDMERLLSRLFASCEATGRNANKVVLYEDAAKKQLQEFLSALRGCKSMAHSCSLLNASIDNQSSLLGRLLTQCRGFSDIYSVLKHFEEAFDWSEAELSGCIVPREGVDTEYDLALKSLKEIQNFLDEHLEEQQKILRDRSIKYVTVGKDSYLIELPESLQGRVPQEYELRSSKKGFFRYWTPRIKKLFADYSQAEAEKESRKKGILQRLIRRFCEYHDIWRQLVATIAELDVLISLSVASNDHEGPTCRPVIRGTSDSKEALPCLSANSLGHPVLRSDALGKSFVPNDVSIGGAQHAQFLLLTGPNMGGKSTLLRQICLAVILAQVGADVPAQSFELSPVDRIFVRMGARDHIMAGQSTFMTELSETAAMLTLATQNSLVALDELGRGTSTSDGQAIAQSVMEHFVRKIGCRGIFSTHYHRLAVDYENDPQVALCHMACKVDKGGGVEEVTFLYRLTTGACPKSYGVNVARLAGFPDSVLKKAAKKSIDFEAKYGTKILNEDEIAAMRDILCHTASVKDREDLARSSKSFLNELQHKVKLLLQGSLCQ